MIPLTTAAYPRSGNPDIAAGITVKTYVATELLKAVVSNVADAALNLNDFKKAELRAAVISAVWDLAEEFLNHVDAA